MPIITFKKTLSSLYCSNTEMMETNLHIGDGKMIGEILEDMLQPIPEPILPIPSFVSLPETGSIIARDKMLKHSLGEE